MMLHVEVESPSPPLTGPTPSPAPGSAAALAALSRNASVISSSSSSSSSSSLLLNTSRPRPLRTFSSPRNRSPAGGPPTPTRAKAPLYLSKEVPTEQAMDAREAQSRASVNKSRSNSAAGRLGPNDFEFGEVLGEGSYSTVMSAVYRRKAYAIKIIDKDHLVRKNMVKTANVEKSVLTKLGVGNHPGIVRLHWAFQDQWSLYFVLDLVPNGELQTRISRLGSICLPCARWYTAQMIDTAAWMHERGIMHRDLKPENVLLDDDMRIKITDFGSAKILEPGLEDERSNSWVGTPQYVPPELLFSNTTCKSSDYWAIGCILYQMISGHFPFQGVSNYLMWGKIKNLDYSFPEGFDALALDLVQRLLVLDPEARLGAGKPGTSNDLEALRGHPFFEPLSWDRLWSDPVPPLEAGIVKKELNLNGSSDAFDVGAEWDRLVGEEGGEGEEEEEEEEGEYTEEPELRASAEEPIHMPRGMVADSGVAGLERDTRRGVPDTGHSQPPPVCAPVDVRDSSSSGGSTAGGSPTERLGGLLDSLTLASRSRRPSTTSSNDFSDSTQWMSLLRPSETPVLTSHVHKAPRRTFPRQLLPLPGSAKKGLGSQSRDKDKVRLLVLTKTRLLCLKERDGAVVLKNEALIGGQGSGNGVVIGVEEKGDKTFIVQTASKSYTYTIDDPTLVSRWVQEIGDALRASRTPNPEPQSSISDRP